MDPGYCIVIFILAITTNNIEYEQFIFAGEMFACVCVCMCLYVYAYIILSFSLTGNGFASRG